MRAALVDKITVPWWAGVSPNHKGNPLRVRACGFDVETAKGVPFALGFSSGGPPDVYAVENKTALLRLVACLRSVMNEHDRPSVVAFAHVLRFDLGVMLYPHLKVWNGLTARQGVLVLPGAVPISVEYYFGKVVFARVRIGKQTAFLVDSFRFFTCSLDDAGRAIGLDVVKREKPPGLGTRRIPLAEVRPYLARDVEMVTRIGERINEWHRRFDLRPSVSVPQLAMRLFCHKFVTARWQDVSPKIRRAALLAYHAGRNGLYVRPGWRRVKLLDMNSAFPWAMTQLPSLSKGKWRGDFLRTLTPATVRPWAFYRLYRGTVAQRPYPILFDHEFKALPDGPLRAPVWVTGMELGAAVRAGLLCDGAAIGYTWHPESRDRPLRDYVRTMYRRRRAARSPENRNFFKLMMNSLYGKFIGKVEDVTAEGTRYTAGAQFYPVVAAWITGLVRVRLWEQERRTGAFHSATDGLMVAPGVPVRPSQRLGAWKVEGHGHALILRNKFYLVFAPDGRLLKCAFHGYDGDTGVLLEMLRAGRPTYRVDRLRGWLESAALGGRPFVADRRRFRVTCALRGYWPPPCPVVIPVGGGWSEVAWSRADVLNAG